MTYNIYKRKDGGRYERMEYVTFHTLEEAKGFVWSLKESAKLYLGLHNVHYKFMIRKGVN